MSRKSERLFEAIGGVKDEFLDEAVQAQPVKRFPWKRYTTLAAALLLVVGIGTQLLPRMGGGGSETGAAFGGADGSSVFMSYDGPVFPMTLAEENQAVTATRDVTLDFAPWLPVWISNESRLEEARANGATEAELEEYAADLADWYEEGGYYRRDTNILVTDEYILTNSTTEEQTVEVYYPFVSSLREMESDTPSITVDGSKCLGQVVPGGYCGGFMGAGGDEDSGERLNLDQPTSWEDYQAVLSDGSYLEQAMGPWPDLSNVTATVYRFTDPWGPAEDEDDPNPSIRVWFELDYSRTTVLSYGFHSGSFDTEAGTMGRGFSIPEEWQPGYGEPYYLIILGDDIENMTIDCYGTGGWDAQNTVEGGVKVECYQVTLDEALRDVARIMYSDDWKYGEAISCPFELYYGLLCDYLLTYGVLSDQPAERYDYGWLDELDFDVVDRVFYLCQDVTIPAQSQVTVSLCQSKEASFDHHCAQTENQGINGYDMVTTLASNLTFTQQTARLEDHGQIEIVRENFGFDLEAGIREVTLDMDCEHYYLEVRHAEPEE